MNVRSLVYAVKMASKMRLPQNTVVMRGATFLVATTFVYRVPNVCLNVVSSNFVKFLVKIQREKQGRLAMIKSLIIEPAS